MTRAPWHSVQIWSNSNELVESVIKIHVHEIITHQFRTKKSIGGWRVGNKKQSSELIFHLVTRIYNTRNNGVAGGPSNLINSRWLNLPVSVHKLTAVIINVSIIRFTQLLYAETNITNRASDADDTKMQEAGGCKRKPLSHCQTSGILHLMSCTCVYVCANTFVRVYAYTSVRVNEWVCTKVYMDKSGCFIYNCIGHCIHKSRLYVSRACGKHVWLYVCTPEGLIKIGICRAVVVVGALLDRRQLHPHGAACIPLLSTCVCKSTRVHRRKCTVSAKRNGSNLRVKKSKYLRNYSS